MIFVDLETTANGGPSGTDPDAHWRCNEVLLYGHRVFRRGGTIVSKYPNELRKDIEREIRELGQATLIAHNAKFDIKYLMRNMPDLSWHRIHVHDTMTFEYLDSGHRELFPSLERVAKICGVPFTKTLDLDALLSSGLKMEDIPTETLAEYLEGDVHVLENIWKAQNIRAKHNTDHILPLAEMELNGLPLDMDKAKNQCVSLLQTADLAERYVKDWIKKNCIWQDGSSIETDDFSDAIYPKSKCITPMSNRVISMIMTGAPAEIKITPKWRFKLTCAPVLDQAGIRRIYGYDIEPTHLGYPLDEDTIDKVTKHIGQPLPILEHLMEHRKATKVVSTYLLPMLAQARVGGTVHPKLNTAVTATGRLSSSQPNGQNMPPVVREMLHAESNDRVLEEVDYSQLETVCAAALSECDDLINALNDGRDIHLTTATSVFGVLKAKQMRKIAKAVNFGILYGGKAKGLSLSTGVDEGTIKKLIDAFFTEFPGVKTWQKQFFEDIVDGMEALDIKDGEQRYKSDYVLPRSRRKFRFIETQAPAWIRKKTGRRFSFSPNQTANYPIQGFAGGDVAMHGLVWLWRNIREDYAMDEVMFRLTVHDSMLLERPSEVDLTARYASMCKAVEREFSLPVEVNVDVESDFYWR
jgi:DNA polymerase I-like protein with 3'-5' exonuclease and polymerase domains